MKIFGVELQTPTVKRLSITMIALCFFVWMIFRLGETHPSMDKYGMTAAAIGGALAHAYGVSFRKNGIRAIPVLFLFVLLVSLLSRAVSSI